ncbi:MAG: EpsG family protein, partial [Mariprofundales bacterium]
VTNYVDAQMQSSGALIRVVMNALPAIIFIVYYQRWKKTVHIDSYWPIIAIVAIICLPLVSMASTAVDRMALYVIPLQLYVWSYLPVVLRNLNIRIAIIAYHAAVMFVWLNYATHAKYWLPYQNVLFVW